MSLNAQPIKEVKYQEIFDPPNTYLSLNANGISEKTINKELVSRAIADAKSEGLQISLLKVLHMDRPDAFFFVFEIEGHDDLYWVYKSDALQQHLVSKFRFSDS